MKILIIGAGGYIGSHVAAVFADAGHEVSALTRPGRAPLPPRYGHVTGDLAEPGSLTAAAAGYDRVIHVGAPLGDSTDRAGAEALLASGSPLIYTTGAAVLGAGAQDEDSPADPHPVAAGPPSSTACSVPAAGLSAPAWSTATTAVSCMACSPPKPPSAALAPTPRSSRTSPPDLRPHRDSRPQARPRST